MALADARCTALQVQSLVSAGAVSAAGPISGASVNADVAASRILTLVSEELDTITTAVIPGLTAAGIVFVQEVYDGNVVPVQAEVTALGGGFAVTLTAAAPMPAGKTYWVYIAKY